MLQTIIVSITYTRVIINRVMNHYYNHTQLLRIYYNHNYYFIIVFTMISYYYCLL